MNETLFYWLLIAGLILVLPGIATILIWVERRMLALWQDRYGPNRLGPFGILIIFADMIKILFKEDWIPPFADKAIFVVAPGIVMTTAFMVVPSQPARPARPGNAMVWWVCAALACR